MRKVLVQEERSWNAYRKSYYTYGKTSEISVCKLVEQLRCCICKYICQPKWFRRTVEVRVLSLIHKSALTVKKINFSRPAMRLKVPI